MEKTVAPIMEKAVEPIMEKTVAPIMEKTEVPVMEKTVAPVMEKTEAPIIEKTVAPIVHRSLLAIGGQYNDAQFPLDMPIVMGREATRCNIVFAMDTKGVSKVHCEVKCECGRVYLTDLGSTYGTLINEEKQIGANETVELQPGDIFRIGKQETYKLV